MSKSRAPFTHAVWWRYQNTGCFTTWHEHPRLYRSETSARMAARDLNKFYSDQDGGNFSYHVAVPIGVHPDVAMPDSNRINPTFYKS